MPSTVRPLEFGLVVSALLLLLPACAPTELPPEEYLRYVASVDSGLLVWDDVPPLQVGFRYIPGDARRLVAGQNPAEDTELEFYQVRVRGWSPSDSRMSQLDRDAAARYLAFEFPQALRLLVGRDTLDPVLAHAEDLRGLLGEVRVSLAYPASKASSRKLLFAEPSQGVEQVAVKISGWSMRRIPTLVN